MAKFISVLNSQLNQPIWTAVQWAETRAELQSNRFYSAGVNLSLLKHEDDEEVGQKTITEIATGATANVTMIKLSTASVNLVRLSANKATKTFIKNIEKSLS